ncbi:ERF family protein [Streptomyces sp. CH6]|uniref:ERF family protein n=1 Tax=unclassified Streptomyces TaxID=2593676 RepID=UPI003CFFE95F
MTVTTLPLPPGQTAPATADDSPTITTAYVPAPAGAAAELPRVFQVIHGVMRDVMPVAKGQKNTQQNYSFRGVDDAMSAMAGPMRQHGCFIAPEVIEHRQRPRGDKGTHTVLRMLYRIFGPAGDCLLVTLPGEAMDTADKSTNKAMSAALKYMLFQVFMIPVDARSIDDADRETPVMSNAPQPRQQQRKNGQARRNNRSEADPWERGRPNAPRTPARPPRDYLAEVKKCGTSAEARALYEEAKSAGASRDYLARLAEIGSTKRVTNQQQPQQTRRAPQTRSEPPQEQTAAALDHEQGAALGEFYDAARDAGLTRDEATAVMKHHHHTAPEAAPTATLRAMRDDLLAAAEENGAAS